VLNPDLPGDREREPVGGALAPLAVSEIVTLPDESHLPVDQANRVKTRSVASSESIEGRAQATVEPEAFARYRNAQNFDELVARAVDKRTLAAERRAARLEARLRRQHRRHRIEIERERLRVVEARGPRVLVVDYSTLSPLFRDRAEELEKSLRFGVITADELQELHRIRARALAERDAPMDEGAAAAPADTDEDGGES
jgi:hypothetical protein